MYVPRLIPSILRKNDEKIICTPRNSHIDQKSTSRTCCSGPNPLAAHFQTIYEHPASPPTNSAPPSNNPDSNVTRFKIRVGDTALRSNRSAWLDTYAYALIA